MHFIILLPYFFVGPRHFNAIFFKNPTTSVNWYITLYNYFFFRFIINDLTFLILFLIDLLGFLHKLFKRLRTLSKNKFITEFLNFLLKTPTKISKIYILYSLINTFTLKQKFKKLYIKIKIISLKTV